MGATASGSISAEFINLPVDGSNEDSAQDAIRNQVVSFLRNACSDWNNALGEVSVEISEFTGGSKFGRIRVSNEVTVTVQYNPDEHDLSDWASDNMAAILATGDDNMDYEIEDEDADDTDEVDYDLDEGDISSQQDILTRRVSALDRERITLRDQVAAKDAEIAGLTTRLAQALNTEVPVAPTDGS